MAVQKGRHDRINLRLAVGNFVPELPYEHSVSVFLSIFQCFAFPFEMAVGCSEYWGGQSRVKLLAPRLDIGIIRSFSKQQGTSCAKTDPFFDHSVCHCCFAGPWCSLALEK